VISRVVWPEPEKSQWASKISLFHLRLSWITQEDNPSILYGAAGGGEGNVGGFAGDELLFIKGLREGHGLTVHAEGLALGFGGGEVEGQAEDLGGLRRRQRDDVGAVKLSASMGVMVWSKLSEPPSGRGMVPL
jgi:hypothetical protein